MDENTIYLSPAPLYHAAPLRFNMSVMRLGGTSVIMEHFDAEEFLRARRPIQGHAHPARADHVRALPEAARRGAAEIRRLLAALRHPCRRPLPHPGQGEDDRLVGPDRLGVLRRHRGQRPHHLQRPGMDGAQGHGRPRHRGHAQDLRRGRQRAAGRRSRAPSTSPTAASSSITTIRRRPPNRATPRVGPPWATWATSMPTASCT